MGKFNDLKIPMIWITFRGFCFTINSMVNQSIGEPRVNVENAYDVGYAYLIQLPS